jgi:hypothetical protein
MTDDPTGSQGALSAPTRRDAQPVLRDYLAPGTQVGRYRIVEALAAGAMGVVFKAYDPELSRHVALKVVHRSSIDLDWLANGDEYEARLLDEARVLAKLSHPNVVAAFDVGRFRGSVFVTMELIEGMSLSAWLASGAHSRREVLSLLVAAGRGLAAAHQAGVVHRDFKLSNVMVSADGRAQVVDFGLAHPIGAVKAGELDEAFMASGVVMGTPGYIAPEQFEGSAGDARSDQFSYASAAFRALTGKSAYDATSLESYRAALARGEPAKWPARVPRALRRVVDRGLALRPEQRFSTLGELVDALESTTKPPRWRIGAALAATLAAGALATGAVLHRQLGQRCQADLTSFDRVWGAARREAVERAFGASGNPLAGQAFARIAAGLQAYRDRWEGMKRDACLATHVRGEQSEKVLDLRGSCLDAKLAQLATFTNLLAQADSKLVERAPQALGELAPLEDCADVQALEGESDSMPREPERRAEFGRLKSEYDAIDALSALGKWDEALSRAQVLGTQAEHVGYKSVAARTMFIEYFLLERLGRRDEAGAMMTRTLAVAAEGRVHDAIANVSLRLLLLAIDGERMSEAKAMLPLVEAHVGLAGNRPEFQIRLATYRSAVLAANNEVAAATEQLQWALALCASLGESTRRVCLNPERELGFLNTRLKDYRAAARAFASVAQKAKELYGPSHPNVLNEYNNLAETLAKAGDADAALAALAESKKVGAKTRQSANIPMTEGLIWDRQGDCARAVPFYQEGLAAVSAGYGRDSYQAAVAERLLGSCLAKLGKTGEAVMHLERSVQICRAARVAPAKMGEALFALAEGLWPLRAEQHRASTLAHEALASFQNEGALAADDARDVQAWLDAHQR